MAKDSQKDGGGKGGACQFTMKKLTMARPYRMATPPVYAGKAATGAALTAVFAPYHPVAATSRRSLSASLCHRGATGREETYERAKALSAIRGGAE